VYLIVFFWIIYLFLMIFPFLCHFLTFYPDFQHALVLEPQNKTASLAEKRLRKNRSWYQRFFRHWPSYVSRMLMAVDLAPFLHFIRATRGRLVCVGGMLHFLISSGNFVLKSIINKGIEIWTQVYAVSLTSFSSSPLCLCTCLKGKWGLRNSLV